MRLRISARSRAGGAGLGKDEAAECDGGGDDGHEFKGHLAVPFTHAPQPPIIRRHPDPVNATPDALPPQRPARTGPVERRLSSRRLGPASFRAPSSPPTGTGVLERRLSSRRLGSASGAASSPAPTGIGVLPGAAWTGVFHAPPGKNVFHAPPSSSPGACDFQSPRRGDFLIAHQERRLPAAHRRGGFHSRPQERRFLAAPSDQSPMTVGAPLVGALRGSQLSAPAESPLDVTTPGARKDAGPSRRLESRRSTPPGSVAPKQWPADGSAVRGRATTRVAPTSRSTAATRWSPLMDNPRPVSRGIRNGDFQSPRRGDFLIAHQERRLERRRPRRRLGPASFTRRLGRTSFHAPRVLWPGGAIS